MSTFKIIVGWEMYAYKLYSQKHSNLHCQLSSFQQKVCNSIDGIPLRQWRTMQGERNKQTFEGLKQTINTLGFQESKPIMNLKAKTTISFPKIVIA